MIQILPCPGCNRSTALPQDVSLEAEIRCPHCEQQFVLGQTLNATLGYWEVVHDPSKSELSTQTDDTNKAPVSQEDEPELSLADDSASEETQKKKPDWSNFEPITHDHYEKLKRKSRSPIWSILQIALGGFAAIPVALLILWHGLGRDIMDAGPTVARYVPWIVPQQFRPYPDDDDQFQQHLEKSIENRRRQEAEIPNGQNLQVGPDEHSPQLAPDLPDSPNSESAKNPTESPKPSSSSDAPNRTSELSSDQRSLANENVFVAIGQCEQAVKTWQAALQDPEPEQLRTLARDVYSHLVSLAVLIDKLPDVAPVVSTIRDQMEQMARIVYRKPQTVSLVKQGAIHELANRSSPAKPQGLAIIIEIETATEEEEFWNIIASNEFTDELDEPIAIKVPRYLSPTLIPQQQLLLLGIVSNDSPGNGSLNETGANSRVFRASYLYSYGH